MIDASKGYIKLFRKIQDSFLWKATTKEPFSRGQAWIDILISCNHADGKANIDGKPVMVKRGEWLTSILDLADKWCWGRKKTSNFLNTLEKESMIEQKRNNKYTLIKVLEYDAYQSSFNTEEHQRNIRGTSEEHQRNTNNNNKELKNYIHTYRGEIQQANFEQVSGLNSEQKNTLNDWFDKINDKYPKPCRERKGRMLFFGLFTSYPESMWLSIREDMVQAIQDTLDEYDKQNPDDKSYKFLKNYGTWLEDECMERLLKVERNKQND